MSMRHMIGRGMWSRGINIKGLGDDDAVEEVL
jgi:hypothetical protein